MVTMRVRGELCHWIMTAMSLAVCFGFVQSRNAVTSPKDVVERERDARRVNVEVINATSITLRWSAATSQAGLATNCPPQKFVIRLRQAGMRRSRAWKLEPERHSVSLHDLQPGTEYQVRVTTVNCEGQRKHSRWARLTTEAAPLALQQSGQQETQAPGQPTAVRTRTYADSAIVTWLPPEDNTVVRRYMIGYGEGVPDVKWIYVNGSQRNVTIQNLKPSTQYVISVRAMNSFGKGLVVYDLVYTRDANSARLTPGGSLPAPIQLSSTVLSPHSVWLQWIDPSLDAEQKITDERYYNVYYHAAPSGKNLSVIVKALHVTLHDLIPNRLYRFKVRTVKGVHTSPFSENIANRTRSSYGGNDHRTTDESPSFNTPTDSESSRRGTHGDFDNNDDDDDDENDDAGRQGIASDQGKTKRAHHSRGRPSHGTQPQPALARTLSDPVNTTSSSSESRVRVNFRSLVQYRISAYVTWPDRMVPCAENQSAVAGYIFRYKAVEQEHGGGSNEYVIRNLATNFVLLDNLMPGLRYRYQVKYVMEKGEASAWSQEAELDTTHRPSRL